MPNAPLQRLGLILITAVLAACSERSELVGKWQGHVDADPITMVLAGNHTGSFVIGTQSALIQKWWIDGEVLHYINADDREQTMKVLSVQSGVLTVEEPLGSGRVTVWHRLP